MKITEFHNYIEEPSNYKYQSHGIVLACIIFSLFASSPPVVNPDAAVTMVWSYIGELVFNML